MRSAVASARSDTVGAVSRWVCAAAVASLGLSACARDAAREAERTLTSRDTSSQLVIESSQSVILGPEHAPALMRQCGHEAPAGLTGYWAPDAETLGHLEARLPAMLDAEVPVERRLRRGHITIMRQYVGFMRDGRKVIYVNGWPQQGPQSTRWLETVGGGCGGGALVFGVLYDPETRTFSDFAGNGDW